MSATVRDQIDLENHYMERSAEKYYASQDKLRNKKQADQTDAIQYIMRDGIAEAGRLLENIVERQTRGIGAKYNQLVKLAAARVDETTGEVVHDYNSIIYIALTVLFRAMGNPKSSKFTYLKTALAHAMESDAKARLFEAAYPGYFFTVMKSMQEQGVTQYQHIHKVIMTKFNHFELEWNAWNIHEINSVAQKVYNAILVAMPDIFFKNTFREGNKSVTYIDTTVEADNWFAEFEKAKGLVNPSLPPMLIPPVEWSADSDGNITGGYLTPRMAMAVPFVKAISPEHKEFVRQNVPEQHIAAVNKMQNTAWRINNKVLEVQKQIFKAGKGGVGIPHYLPKELLPFPEHLKNIPVELLSEKQQAEVLEWKKATKQIHTENRLNKSKVIAYKMTYDTALEYATTDQVFFVYNTDFRGRVYCATTGLSPQGNDLAKSLLHFSEGITMGNAGLNWLAIHGANTYGIDKVSNDDRIKWIKDHELQLRAVAERPLDTTEFWGSADKPWQFLAFVFEWARTDYGRDSSVRGFLPIGLDGSCNGIQHYSAILRDSTGGSGVNLKDSDLPSDIYGDVAKELVRILKDSHSTEPEAKKWLAAGINRKLAKRPVMTLPYGSTQQSAKQYVYEWILDNKRKFGVRDQDYYSLAVYLTPILWRAIGNVIIASRAAMSWLQRTAGRVLKETKKPLCWISPVGFPVYQAYMQTKQIRVDTMLLGSITLKDDEGTPDQRITSSYRKPTQQIDKTRQKSGIAPNFIHSIDASHMVRTINATDFNSYAMIHDDFGTHAGNTQKLWEVIRQEFVGMYTHCDPLQDWYDYQNISGDPQIPAEGDLDINEVLTSTYFFG